MSLDTTLAPVFPTVPADAERSSSWSFQVYKNIGKKNTGKYCNLIFVSLEWA